VIYTVLELMVLCNPSVTYNLRDYWAQHGQTALSADNGCGTTTGRYAITGMLCLAVHYDCPSDKDGNAAANATVIDAE
jgi:hypothetical protein